MTGLQKLEEVIGKLWRRSGVVVLCKANARVRQTLMRAGVLAALGKELPGNAGRCDRALRADRAAGTTVLRP
ncbi:hypothetical protein CupriaWKF_19020 [Cupriavidus sp. WKF15]|uniref:hypothetical protein n=1 Tax=Cupriavidus sp. WKF15 TaxID=3032282 RepID=UPI0023E21EE7|nr:hypothetical protein [Cupriavidus sp. WKF15]WER49252.1 hypothetical protein CupriaWKF_19020 [Cupriavidus sp. WKF15]